MPELSINETLALNSTNATDETIVSETHRYNLLLGFEWSWLGNLGPQWNGHSAIGTQCGVVSARSIFVILHHQTEKACDFFARAGLANSHAIIRSDR